MLSSQAPKLTENSIDNSTFGVNSKMMLHPVSEGSHRKIKTQNTKKRANLHQYLQFEIQK